MEDVLTKEPGYLTINYLKHKKTYTIYFKGEFMEKTFENAKVGDRVCDINYPCEPGKTNSTIVEIDKTSKYTIEVGLDGGGRPTYTVEGQSFIGKAQCLFWSKPVFEIPARPKRMVKKMVYLGYKLESYTNSDKKQWYFTSCLYLEKAYIKEMCLEFKIIPVEI